MKRRIVVGVLVTVALWPLAHRGLVARYGIDPWKLGGFAMYATPAPPVVVALVDRSVGEALIDEHALPGAARLALDRFRIERHALGSLREPGDVAAALYEARPGLGLLVVVVQTARLDRRTARVTTGRVAYAYGPDGRIVAESPTP